VFKKSIIEFVSKFTKFPVVPDRFKFGLVTFSFDAEVKFHQDSYTDNATLLDAIDNVASSIDCDGASNAHAAFDVIGDVLFCETRGERKDVGKVIILFSDGLFSNPVSAEIKARTLKRDFYASVYCVATGQNILHRGLLGVASVPSHVSSIHEDDWMYRILQGTMFDCDGTA